MLLEALDAVLPADTAHLVSTERGVGAVEHAAVDHQRAGADTTGDGHGPLVGAMDSAGQAVGGVVRHLDGAVVTAVVRGYGQHRPEDLLLEDRVVRGDVRNNGRCHEESAVQTVGHAATDGDAASVTLGDLD